MVGGGGWGGGGCVTAELLTTGKLCVQVAEHRNSRAPACVTGWSLFSFLQAGGDLEEGRSENGPRARPCCCAYSGTWSESHWGRRVRRCWALRAGVLPTSSSLPRQTQNGVGSCQEPPPHPCPCPYRHGQELGGPESGRRGDGGWHHGSRPGTQMGLRTSPPGTTGAVDYQSSPTRSWPLWDLREGQ